MKKFLLVCFFSMLAIGSAWAQSSLVPSGASFDEVNNIKIGDDLKPVDNNASEINLTSEQQATQDYIDPKEEELTDGEKSLPKDPTQQYIEDKEDELAAGEEALPYNPNAPVSPSGSGLGSLANQDGLDAGAITIDENLNPVDNTLTDINLTPEQQAVQDYIDQQEDELADSEASLPYDPSAPISSSGSGLGSLANQNAFDSSGISIGKDLMPVDNSSQTPATQTPATQTPATQTPATQTPSTQTPTSQEGTPAGVEVEKASDSTGIQNANADSPANTANGLAGCSGTVFEQIKCKILQFLSSLRTIAYVISGFGIIFFAWAAIFGKVNWKHLSSIGVGLFLLSMIGPFIEYFSGDSSVKSVLGYGNFIDGEFKYVEGTPYGGSVDSSQVPDTNVENNNSSSIITGGGKGTDSGESEGKKKMSLTDLFNAGKSAVDTVRNVSNAIQNTDWDINNIDQIIKNFQTTYNENSNGFENIQKLAQTGADVVGGEGVSAIDTSKEQEYWQKGQNYAQKIGDLFKKDNTEDSSNQVDPSKPYTPDSSPLASQANQDGLDPGKINW